MLVFVDYEHESGRDGELGQAMSAARTWLTYRLEDLSGRHCHLVRYHRLDHDLLDRLGAEAVFISGNSVDPDRYSPDEVEGIVHVLRTTHVPVFGFCGGFQLIALALGAQVVELDAADIDPAEFTSDPARVTRLDSGRPFESGYFPVDLAADDGAHPVLVGVGERPVFRHAHGLHVPNPPAGFEVLASTPATPVQLAVHDERRIVGTQFHPEYWTDEHPAGRTLIANFLAWAGVAADSSCVRSTRRAPARNSG